MNISEIDAPVKIVTKTCGREKNSSKTIARACKELE
jgi:hypothetical protein